MTKLERLLVAVLVVQAVLMGGLMYQSAQLVFDQGRRLRRCESAAALQVRQRAIRRAAARP